MNTTRSSFFRYVSLSILGTLGMSCYILADTFFIAQGVGPDGLTALNLAIPAYSLMHGVGLMIGVGGATRYALAHRKETFTQALWLAGAAALLFFAAGVFFARPLAHTLGANGATLTLTENYLRTLLAFAPLFVLNNLLLAFVRNDGAPQLTMAAMLLGSAVNIVLDYIFIFPLGLGMFGAALATGVSPGVGLAVLSLHFVRRKNSFAPCRLPPQPRALLDVCTLGLSSLLAELSSGVVMIVFNFTILGLAGNLGVAAYGVLANIALVVVSIFTGIAQGMQPLLSAAYGKGDAARLAEVRRLGFITVFVLAAAAYAVCAGLAGPIVTVFNRDGDAQLAAIAVRGLRIYFTAFFFMGANILAAAAFSATDRARSAFFITVLRGLVVVVPAVLALAALFGLDGVWLSVPVTEAVVLAVWLCAARRSHAAPL